MFLFIFETFVDDGIGDGDRDDVGVAFGVIDADKVNGIWDCDGD